MAKRRKSGAKGKAFLTYGPNILLLIAVIAGAIWFIEGQANLKQEAEITVGGDFSLTDHKGHPVTEKDFYDKPMAIFFGYTYCPDICPTTLYEMTQWVETLGKAADEMHFVFVSVDAARDDQDTLASYVDAFFDGLVGLYGTEKQLKTIIKAYRVYVKKNQTKNDPDDYTIDHTASVYLMKPGNQFSGTISYGESIESAVSKLQQLIAESS